MTGSHGPEHVNATPRTEELLQLAAKRFLASARSEDLGKLRDHPEDYVSAISEYFRLRPYRSWFNKREWLLEGLGVSYYGTDVGTALHTDM